MTKGIHILPPFPEIANDFLRDSFYFSPRKNHLILNSVPTVINSYSSSVSTDSSSFFPSSGTIACTQSTKQRFGYNAHHQFCPLASPISIRNASYSPAGNVTSPYVLSGKLYQPTLARTGYAYPSSSTVCLAASSMSSKCSSAYTFVSFAFLASGNSFFIYAITEFLTFSFSS